MSIVNEKWYVKPIFSTFGVNSRLSLTQFIIDQGLYLAMKATTTPDQHIGFSVDPNKPEGDWSENKILNIGVQSGSSLMNWGNKLYVAIPGSDSAIYISSAKSPKDPTSWINPKQIFPAYTAKEGLSLTQFGLQQRKLYLAFLGKNDNGIYVACSDNPDYNPWSSNRIFGSESGQEGLSLTQFGTPLKLYLAYSKSGAIYIASSETPDKPDSWSKQQILSGVNVKTGLSLNSAGNRVDLAFVDNKDSKIYIASSTTPDKPDSWTKRPTLSSLAQGGLSLTVFGASLNRLCLAFVGTDNRIYIAYT